MKRILGLVAALAFAVPLGAQNTAGSDHDLRGKTGSQIQDYGQVCAYCHTPHNATTNNVALWNRSLTGLGPYTMYYPTTHAGQSATPQPASLACLSCHDGTVALDLIVNKPPGGGNSLGGKMTGSEVVGPDLSNDHPISIDYPSAPADFNASPVGPKLYTNKVECASCHNPHSTQYGAFLRMSNTGSALCLACHKR